MKIEYMKKKIVALLLSFCCIGLLTAQELTLKDVVSGKYSARSSVYGINSMKNSNVYTSLNREHSAILRYSFETGELIDTLFSVSNARDCDFENFDSYLISDDGKQILLFRDTEYIYRRSYKSNVYHYEVSRRKVSPLSEVKGKIMIPTFSPDGRMVAFVRDGNIFIKKFDYDTEVQVTDDAKFNCIMNGVTDWVYEEEFSITNLMKFSDDSNMLAYVKTNETDVPEYSMPMYNSMPYDKAYKYKYPKAGSPNSIVSLHVYDIKMNRSKEVSLPKLKTDNLKSSISNSDVEDICYIPRIDFDENKLMCFTLNRRQNILSIYSVDILNLIPKLLLQDKDECYIEAENVHKTQFVNDGILMMSERDGYNHLYLFSKKGVLKKQITKGNWDVTDFYGMDNSGSVFYQSAEDSPIRRSVYSVDKNGKKTKLSVEDGTNDAIFSGDFKYYINIYSNVVSPIMTTVRRTSNNKDLRVLEDNKTLREHLERANLPKKEFIQVPNGNGDMLNAWIVKPSNFDETKKYPLLMVQYSGPGSQQVLDSYSIGWEYFLAEKGYVVLNVDGRGTGARGAKFKKCTYMKLGLLESDDQISVASYFANKQYIDKNKIAIWGWSFGGYMTLMALTRGAGVFSSGIAVAPVSDWRFYDTIYTERYMRTPQENPKGYEMSSALYRAEDLKGNLLIIHGSADDNVHLQNTMMFTDKLIKKNIDFQEAIYPDKNHSIYGGNTRIHLYNKMFKFLENNLK